MKKKSNERVWRVNLDGINVGIIAASGKNHAADICRMSMFSFNERAREITDPGIVQQAMTKPGVLFVKKYNDPISDPWSEKSWPKK